jgi:hypothetical protein
VLKDVTTKCLLTIDPTVHPLDYESILEAEKQSDWAVREMRMNRAVFRRCMKRLGKGKPKDVYSLRQLWQWLGYTLRPDNQDTVLRLEAAIIQAMEVGRYWEFYQEVHQDRQAALGTLRRLSQDVISGTAVVVEVDHWLHSQQRLGYNLSKRREYLAAFQSWKDATDLELFKRLVETFETQTRDAELLLEQYETLRTLRKE